MVICSRQNIPAVCGFQGIWFSVNERSLSCVAEGDLLSKASSVLIFADLNETDDLKHACVIGESIKNLDVTRECPVVLLVCRVANESQLSILNRSVGQGIDVAITEDISGFKFALSVHNRLKVELAKARKFEEYFQKIDGMYAKREHLQEMLHETLYTYFRERLQLRIPEINLELDDNMSNILGARIGRYLGKGSFGRVHKLEPIGTCAPTREVVKFIRKDCVPCITDVKLVSRHINVMQILSSKELQHPNIVQLYEVYHSKTYVILRMEDGGPANLHSRISARDCQRSPLSVAKVRHLMVQLIDAVSHLHLRANVVHRDLKPENVIVSEWTDRIVVKVADFDAACINPRIPCRGIVGTFPFASPEVLLSEVYDPYALDVWSFGMVLMEIFCGSRCLEQKLELRVPHDCDPISRLAFHKELTSKICDFFKQPEVVCNFFIDRVCSDLSTMMAVASPLLLGCLQESEKERWSASQCLEHATNNF